MNETPQLPKDTRAATYIGRVVAGCIGGAVVVLLIALKAWQKFGISEWLTSAAFTGLCLGYALGGDIWGARLFDLFTGHSSRKDAKNPVHPVIQKTMLF